MYMFVKKLTDFVCLSIYIESCMYEFVRCEYDVAVLHAASVDGAVLHFKFLFFWETDGSLFH